MNKYTNINGAEALLNAFIEEGVKTIFGYPGGTIIPIYDSLYSYKDKINHILTRHEQGAVHAAQGYARATGQVGVCIATSGPGATNLLTGIADAMIDSTPLVCVTAQVASSLIGTDAFQEADIISMTIPISKWNYQITKAEEVPRILAKAFYIANSGRPGPVVIEMTKDAQLEMLELFEYKKCNFISSYQPKPIPNKTEIEVAAKMINSASKPLFIIGQGVVISGAEQNVIELAERCGAAMVSTLMGLSAIPTSHPLYFGKIGMHGNVAANELTQNSDLIVVLGMRFSDRVTGDITKYAPKAKIIHIDIDPSELNKIIQVRLGIIADIKDAVAALFPLITPAKQDEWIDFGREKYMVDFDNCISESINPTTEGMTMAEVINMISDKSGNNAIIVTDVGQNQMFASLYSKFNSSRSFITSGGLGTMGFGLPAAIGAKMACPDREVILFVGDGGIQMTIQELGTIMSNNIGVKIIILNNNFLGMVRQWQDLFCGKRYSFTELDSPDFNKVADAYRIANGKAMAREQLEREIDKLINAKGAYLLEVAIEPELNVFPMVPAGASISNVILKDKCNE